MHRYVHLLVIPLLAACTAAGDTTLPLEPGPPDFTTTPLSLLYRVSDSLPLGGDGPSRYARISLQDGQLSIDGRSPGPAYPTFIDSISATAIGSTIVIRVEAHYGAFAAGSHRDYEARIFGLAARRYRVRVLDCGWGSCLVTADTIVH